MKKKLLILLSIALIVVSSDAAVKIILSAALSDAHFEFRKNQYIESFKALRLYGYHDVYVVEALRQNGPTFLDNYTKNVFYSTANNIHLRNKGINEVKTLLQGINHFGFLSNDMMLKITGRYQIISDYFITLVNNNLDYDAIVKTKANGDVWTLCFAMKCKHFQEMVETMDVASIEWHMIDIECAVGNYIKEKVKNGNFKVLYTEKLDVQANLFGSTNWIGAPDQVLYF